MMSHFILEAHIQSIGLANHHNDSFLFQMNHPEYTRNTRTVPAIPGYPELFKIPGIIFSKLFKSTWKFPGIEISRYSRYFFHLRVFRVYPGLPGKLPEYPKNRPGNFQVDPGIPGYPQILLPGKKYLEYLEISIPGNFQVDLYPENTRKNTRKLVKRWLKVAIVIKIETQRIFHCLH